MMVAYPINDKQLEVHSFGCYTRDLHALAQCLKSYGITSAAMESTGIYWVSLFLILQDYGIEVLLANAKHTKNVTGRKTDESDAEWIQKLHSYGLLHASFQPDNMTRTLRSLVRHQKSLVETSSTYLNRMQKSLELMNLKIHTVISDIDVKTGLRNIEAIINGERSPEKLADMSDIHIKASREEIIKSLEGYWIKEHLFELSQCYKLYQTHREMIDDCDREIEKHLLEQIAEMNDGALPDTIFEADPKKKTKRKTSHKHKVSFDLTSYLTELLKVNVTEIVGISELSALTIMAEVGLDMEKFKTANHFTSWLGLAPNTKISAGKVISSRINKKKQYAGQAFRMAACSLWQSQTPLGDFYRRIKSRSGPGKAVVATARKLAIIYYHMVIYKESFNPSKIVEFHKKYKEQKINQLKKKIRQLEAV